MSKQALVVYFLLPARVREGISSPASESSVQDRSGAGG